LGNIKTGRERERERERERDENVPNDEIRAWNLVLNNVRID
jgi:hypothetical protein